MFRQDALENRRMKWRGRAILLPGIPLWLTMLGSIAFITAFLTFVIAGTYSRRVNVSGEVTTWPRAVNIYSGVQGFVVRQFVHEGQSIKKVIRFTRLTSVKAHAVALSPIISAGISKTSWFEWTTSFPVWKKVKKLR